jgi:hypothetical protein
MHHRLNVTAIHKTANWTRIPMLAAFGQLLWHRHAGAKLDDDTHPMQLPAGLHIAGVSTTAGKVQHPRVGNVTLRPYQLRVLQWMQNVEDNAATPYLFDEDVVIPTGDGTNCITVVPGGNVQRRRLVDYNFGSVNARGGIFGNANDTGKSTIIAALINSRPAGVPPPPTVGITSSATLIVCMPSRVIHWRDRIRQSTKADFKVVTISKSADWHKCTYWKLCTADVVIISTHFVAPDRSVATFLAHWTATAPRSPMQNGLMHMKKPYPQLIAWHRVILSDCNKYLSTSPDVAMADCAQACGQMRTSHLWCLPDSGTATTPDTTLNMLLAIRCQMHVHDTHNLALAHGPESSASADMATRWHLQLARRAFFDRYYWADDTAIKYNTAPPCVMRVRMPKIVPTQFDLALSSFYPLTTAAGKLVKRHNQLAPEFVASLGSTSLSPPTLPNPSPHVGSLDRQQQLVRQLEAAVDNHRQEIAIASDAVVSSEHLMKYSIALQQTTEAKSSLAKMEAGMRCIKNSRMWLSTDISNTDCPVCYTPSLTGWFVMPCGHMICRECNASMTGVYQSRCCVCRSAYTLEQTWDIPAATDDLTRMRVLYGSYMAALVTHLKAQNLHNIANLTTVILCDDDTLAAIVTKTLQHEFSTTAIAMITADVTQQTALIADITATTVTMIVVGNTPLSVLGSVHVNYIINYNARDEPCVVRSKNMQCIKCKPGKSVIELAEFL